MKRRLLLNHDSAAGTGPTGGDDQVKAAKPTAIAAKMKCHNQPKIEYGSENISLSAVYAEEGINKAWATSTPSGALSLGINNPGAQGFFQAGKEYIVTIREAQPGE